MDKSEKKQDKNVEIDFGVKKIIIDPDKSTHFLQKVGKDCRITIPQHNRDELGIRPGDIVETIMIKRAKRS